MKSSDSTMRKGPVGRWVGVVVALATALAGAVAAAPPATAAAPTVVSLTFSDGLSSQYRYAAPLLEQHGMDATFYVASSWVRTNDARYMRTYQLDELYRAGHEIGGMGKDHVNLTDPATDTAYKQDQVCGDFAALTDWGYHPASFTYPGGATNAQAQQIVSGCGFLTGRLPGGLSATGPAYAEQVPPANPMALRSATTPAGPLTLQTLQNAVTAAGANGGGWVPIAFSQVCDQSDAGYTACMATAKPVDSAVLGQFLAWLETQASEGVTVETVGQVMGAAHPDLPQRPFVVTLTFDDGLRSQYALKDIFAKHDEHGTFYINSGPVDRGEAGTMTWAQIREMQAAGHDVGGHTTDHVNLLATDTTFDYKWHQVCDDRARLVSQGLHADSFAFPFGAMNADASALVRGCGYQSARKAGTVTSDGPIYSETIPVTENPWAIRILGTNYNGPVTLEALQYAVNQARSHGGSWLPTLFHQICYVGTAGYDACMAGYRPVDDRTIDAFLGWLDGLAGQNVEVKTIAEVMGGGTPAPQVAVTGPAAGSTVTVAQPQLTGTATSGGAVSVRLYDGAYSMGTPLATLSATVSNGGWSVQPASALPDGTYTVQAAQTAGDSTGTSVPVTFTVNATAGPVDTTPPAPTVTEPVADSTVRTATPTLRGTAGTAAGDIRNVQVLVYAGSIAGGTPAQTLNATAGADGRWSVDASALADGVYTVAATQRDAAGNSGTSGSVTFTVSTSPVDVTAPTVTVTSPTAGSSVADTTPQVRGRAGTANGDGNRVSVAFYPSAHVQGDAVQTVQATVAADGSWSTSPRTPLTAGTWTVQATQSDTAGNVGTSDAVTFTVGRKASGGITRVAPARLGQGARAVTVKLSGSGFTRTSTARISGKGVATRVVGRTATALTLRVWVAGNAPVGARGVTATTANGATTTCDGCFRVVAGPRIGKVAPRTVAAGARARLTVTGAHFTRYVAAGVSGKGIRVLAAKQLSASRMLVVVKVAAWAPRTARTLTVVDRSTRGRDDLVRALRVVRRTR